MIDESRLYSLSVFSKPALVDVPTWACTNRYMNSTSSMFSYIQTPFFEEPAHYMSDIASTSMVILKTPAQVGKTTAIENFLGWMYTYYPSNTMLVLDSLKSGMKMSHNRIRPFLRETCGVNNPRNTKKNPDKSNSVINIGLGRGASLFVCSSKSISDLRSTPSRFVLLDEVDAYVDCIEGDPIELALKRQMRFRGMAVLTSTPTTTDGRITQQYYLGTQQTWGVVCDECDKWFEVKYNQIDYTNTVPTIHCPHCGEVYDEDDVKKLEHDYSPPKNDTPYKDELGRIRRSFEVTAPLCHAFYSWDGLKRQEIAALSLGEASYQSFVNTTLGECYTPKEQIEIQVPELMRLSQGKYTHDCLPLDVAFIVCGVDTHDSCLYCETCGFSEDLKRMYGLQYDVLVGDPNESAVWKQFEEIFNKIYTREDGTPMRPAFTFADSGGHRTNAVYLYSFRNRRFMPIKGYVSSKTNAVDPLVGKQQKLKLNGGLKGRCTVQFIGVNAGKDELANAELLTIAGDKRLFYPKGNRYNPDYFKGLLSEKKISGKWIAPQKGHTNNEPLDCRVYAMACASYYLNKYWITGLDTEDIEMAKSKKKKDIEQVEQVEEKKAIEPVDIKPEPKPEKSEEKKKLFPHWD